MPEEREEEEKEDNQSFSVDQLAALPQRLGEVWQASTLRLPAWYADDDGELKRPRITLVTSRTDDLILKHGLPLEDRQADWLWMTIAKAMADPVVGDPRRPGLLQLRSEEDANSLRPHLKRLGIDCVVCDHLDQLDSAFAKLVEDLHGRKMSALVDMPGVQSDQIASYYEAAAYFYRQAPWRTLGEVPVKIECDKFTSGPWYAVVLGPGRQTLGLTLYEDLDLLRKLGSGELSVYDSARIASAVSVVFDQKHDLAPADLDAIDNHGWTVAGDNAYPLAIRLSPGRAVRSLLAWELELVEACLRAIPQFAEEDPQETTMVTVHLEDKELTLRMQSFPLGTAKPEDTATSQPKPVTTAKILSPKHLLSWAVIGALYGVIIGAVFSTSDNAILASMIATPVSALVGIVWGAIFGRSFNKAGNFRGGPLLWAILLGLVGISFALLVSALVTASIGSLKAIIAWLLLRPFFKKDFFLILSCAAVGVVVETCQWNVSAVMWGSTSGAVIGAVVGIASLLVTVLLFKVLIRDATGSRQGGTLFLKEFFGLLEKPRNP